MKYRVSTLATLLAFALCTWAFGQSVPDSAKKLEDLKSTKSEGSLKTEVQSTGQVAKFGVKEEPLLQAVNSTASLKTFAELLKTAELDKTLDEKGEYTIFAPNNAAFKRMSPEALNVLKLDKAKLAELLKNHIVAGKRIGRLDLAKMKGQTIKVESGMELAVAVATGKWMIGNATLTGLNLKTLNGPVHEVDAVITSGAAGNLVAPANQKISPKAAMQSKEEKK
jgi:uncharacterized surface protein with fasciclin (FAS1) repeats